MLGIFPLSGGKRILHTVLFVVSRKSGRNTSIWTYVPTALTTMSTMSTKMRKNRMDQATVQNITQQWYVMMPLTLEMKRCMTKRLCLACQRKIMTFILHPLAGRVPRRQCWTEAGQNEVSKQQIPGALGQEHSGDRGCAAWQFWALGREEFFGSVHCSTWWKLILKSWHTISFSSKSSEASTEVVGT